MKKRELDNKILDLYRNTPWAPDGVINIAMSLEKIDEDKVKAMLGFVAYCEEHNKSKDYIRSNIMHDINGILTDDETFGPRTSSYGKYFKEPEEVPCG